MFSDGYVQSIQVRIDAVRDRMRQSEKRVGTRAVVHARLRSTPREHVRWMAGMADASIPATEVLHALMDKVVPKLNGNPPNRLDLANVRFYADAILAELETLLGALPGDRDQEAQG